MTDFVPKIKPGASDFCTVFCEWCSWTWAPWYWLFMCTHVCSSPAVVTCTTVSACRGRSRGSLVKIPGLLQIGFTRGAVISACPVRELVLETACSPRQAESDPHLWPRSDHWFSLNTKLINHYNALQQSKAPVKLFILFRHSVSFTLIDFLLFVIHICANVGHFNLLMVFQWFMRFPQKLLFIRRDEWIEFIKHSWCMAVPRRWVQLYRLVYFVGLWVWYTTESIEECLDASKFFFFFFFLATICVCISTKLWRFVPKGGGCV